MKTGNKKPITAFVIAALVLGSLVSLQHTAASTGGYYMAIMGGGGPPNRLNNLMGMDDEGYYNYHIDWTTAGDAQEKGSETKYPEKRYHYTVRTKQRLFLLYETDMSATCTYTNETSGERTISPQLNFRICVDMTFNKYGLMNSPQTFSDFIEGGYPGTVTDYTRQESYTSSQYGDSVETAAQALFPELGENTVLDFPITGNIPAYARDTGTNAYDIYQDIIQYVWNDGTSLAYGILLNDYDLPAETPEPEPILTPEPTPTETPEPSAEPEQSPGTGQETTPPPENTGASGSSGTGGSPGGSISLPDVSPYMSIVTYSIILGFAVSFLLWFVGFLIGTGIHLIKAMKEAA